MLNNPTFEKLCDHAREVSLIQSIQELLEWDERVMLPPAGGSFRAEQVTFLSGQNHQRKTDPRLGEWLQELAKSPLASDPHSIEGATIRQLQREYDKKRKVPQELVEALTRESILGQQSWVEARKNDDFSSFQPALQKIVDLKRQQAHAIGFEDVPYDALLDDFEPDNRTANISQILAELRQALVPLVAEIAQSGRLPNRQIVRRSFPIDKQAAFGQSAAAQIGFDFKRGRLDVTHHPFCSGMGPGDCRITTRYDEHFFPTAFFGILHEAGHGIYEQGLRTEYFGLPPGQFVSLGIHESQSRMWENLVGRSRAFWECFWPQAQTIFPTALGDVTLDDFYFAINDVHASLIRVEADEATYNLHIIIRFELEQALINQDLEVADLPTAWNDKYREYLGIEPPNNADGVLQDIHWGSAAIGYFPTYSLGNLYASQFFEAAIKELGNLEDSFRVGDFASLRDWLNTNIHQVGQCYSAAELVEKVSGSPLTPTPLVNHLQDKYRKLYELG
ncbi:MAG: carboxypeptidase M32 [Pirellulaceae bacterium]|nr:carboxypeptidase M32 [Pirellulaceae bacterium]